MTAIERQVRQIMTSNRAHDIVALVQRELELEQQRRLAFYDTRELYEDKREFIHGEIVVQSPAKLWHLGATRRLLHLLSIYVMKKGLGRVESEKAMIRLTRNDFEPDICFFSKEKADNFRPDQSLFPAPDMVVEVLSNKTAKRDRGVKYEDYALHGVREYWIIDAAREQVEQHLLDGDTYQLAFDGKAGQIECQAIENLTFPVSAIFDDAANLAAIQELLK